MLGWDHGSGAERDRNVFFFFFYHDRMDAA